MGPVRKPVEGKNLLLNLSRSLTNVAQNHEQVRSGAQLADDDEKPENSPQSPVSEPLRALSGISDDVFDAVVHTTDTTENSVPEREAMETQHDDSMSSVKSPTRDSFEFSEEEKLATPISEVESIGEALAQKIPCREKNGTSDESALTAFKSIAD
jgi:hypothetical protein